MSFDYGGQVGATAATPFPILPAPQVYNVRDGRFGAVGDGVADDTVALQAAITAAQAVNGTVYFPPGNYKLTAQLLITNRCTLQGGPGSTITEGVAIAGANAAGAMILVQGAAAAGTIVRELTCQGIETEAGFNGGATKQYCFVRFDTANRCLLDNCTIFNKTYGAYFASSNYSAAQHCYVQAFITSPADPGVNFQAGLAANLCTQLTFRGNRIQRVSNGMLLGQCTYSSVVNNTVVLICDDGVYLSGSFGCVVVGNNFDQLNGLGGAGVHINGERNAVIGNTVSNAVGASGVTCSSSVVDTSGGSTYGAVGNVIVGNTFKSIARYAVSVAFDAGTLVYPHNCVVADNTADTVATDLGGSYAGILVYGAGHRITGNILTNVGTGAAPLAGIYVAGTVANPCPSLTIDNNLVDTCPVQGIFVNYIQNGSVSGNKAVAVVGTAFQFRNCSDVIITKNGGGLIFLDNAFVSTSCQVFGNETTYSGDFSQCQAIDVKGPLNLTRLFGKGTAHVAGDYALSAGWGSTATVSAVSAKDTSGRVSITANGSGIAANPTVTLTFKDGTWTTIPDLVATRGELNAPAGADWMLTSITATQAVLTFQGLPVAGTVYTFNFLTMGK